MKKKMEYAHHYETHYIYIYIYIYIYMRKIEKDKMIQNSMNLL